MSDLAASVKVGTRVETTATFSPLDTGTPTDPDTVRFTITAPDGTQTTQTYGQGSAIAKVSTGVYALAHVCDAAGTWWFTWKGESDIHGVNVVHEVAVKAERTVA